VILRVAASINAAHQMHQDEVTGSIERGKLADLIALDRNLFEISCDDISETEVMMTMVGGKIVFRR
jgi:predicted amidohydrolase YtcJ